MFNRFNNKNENKIKCYSDADLYGTKFSLIKNIFTLSTVIEGKEYVNCFSCEELLNAPDSVSEFRQSYSFLPGFGYETRDKNNEVIKIQSSINDEDIQKILDFKQKCSEFEDEDNFSDNEEKEQILLEKDTYPYLIELGIFSKIKDQELEVTEFDDYLRNFKKNIKVGLVQHVENLVRKFRNKYNLDDVPTLNSNFSNEIHANSIDFYKRLISYLEDKELKDEFITVVNNKEFDGTLTLYIDDVKTIIDVDYDEDEKFLVLSFMNITDFCEETIFPKDIEALDIGDNGIQNLDGRDGKFKFPESLTVLWISGNQITNLDGRDGTFRFPESLTELDIARNQITNIDGRSGKFRFPESLKELNISGNGIQNLDDQDGIFSLPRQLKKLDISFNKIVNLDGYSGTFRFPKNLKELYIYNNYIRNLDGQDGDFTFPENLKLLYIYNNQIVNLDGQPEKGSKFRFPNSLKELYIYGNKIKNLEGHSGTFKFPKTLRKLNIMNNNIET